jgi:hypothetical protein
VGAAMLLLVISVVPVNAQVANNSAITRAARPLPISRWQFISSNQDLRIPHTRQSENDWNRIAILSKPYRSEITGLKPFSQWAFENIRVDLGTNYTPQQKIDWDAISILTKPYR